MGNLSLVGKAQKHAKMMVEIPWTLEVGGKGAAPSWYFPQELMCHE